MTASDTTARITPYIEELLENGYARENLRDAARNIRAAYRRVRKRRAKAARDERLRRQVQAAARSLTEAGRALRTGRRKPRRRWGRRLLLLLGLGIAAAGIAVAADEELRASILGSEDRGQQDPEPTPAAEGALAGV
jgi:ferric-dicitrate binding protein FerR (iron transport regulator)